MAKKRLVLLLNAIFSRPDSLLLEPFQVLVRARRTRVGSDAPFTLAGPFPPLEQTVVAMETILHCDSVEEEEGGGGCDVTWSRAAFPAQSCWRTLASHTIKGIVPHLYSFPVSSQEPEPVCASFAPPLASLTPNNQSRSQKPSPHPNYF